MGITFQTAVTRHSSRATALPVPADTLLRLTPQRRPLVSVALAGHRYRTRIAVIRGRPMVPLREADRAAAGVTAGDEVEVQLDLIVEPTPSTTTTPSHPGWPTATAPARPADPTAAEPAAERPTTDATKPGTAEPAAAVAPSTAPTVGSPAAWLLPIAVARVDSPGGGDQVLVVTVAGEVDTLTLDRFRTAVTRAVAAARSPGDGCVLVLDLRSVTYLSGAGLTALLDTVRAARPVHHGPLRHGPVRVVVDIARPVLRLTDLVGRTDLLSVYHRLEHALDGTEVH